MKVTISTDQGVVYDVLTVNTTDLDFTDSDGDFVGSFNSPTNELKIMFQAAYLWTLNEDEK